MALANVSLADTFDLWRTRTNQIIVGLDVAEIKLDSSFTKANAANVLAYNSGITASAGFDKANAANTLAYTAGLTANAGFDKANLANTIASAGYDKANAANVLAYSSGLTASAGFDKANAANVLAYTAGLSTASAYDKANAANVLAYSSGLTANAALANTSGISYNGDLFFPTGNVSVGTNTVFYPAADRRVLSINGTSSSRLALGANGLQNAYLDTVSPGQNTTLASATTLDLATVGSFPLRVLTNSTVRVHVGSGGNVGIGTAAATSPLEVIGTIKDDKGDVRSVPQNAQTASYILSTLDNGKHVSITTGGVTVPSSVFSIGQTVSIYNNSSSSQTITQGGSVTMYLVGTATTGNRTLAQRGVATVLCVDTNTFVITGGGLT